MAIRFTSVSWYQPDRKVLQGNHWEFLELHFSLGQPFCHPNQSHHWRRSDANIGWRQTINSKLSTVHPNHLQLMPLNKRMSAVCRVDSMEDTTWVTSLHQICTKQQLLYHIEIPLPGCYVLTKEINKCVVVDGFSYVLVKTALRSRIGCI